MLTRRAQGAYSHHDSHGYGGGITSGIATCTILLQIVAYVPYQLATLVVPEPALLGLRALWVGFSVVAVLTFRRRPRLALAVPFATFLTCLVLIFLGGLFLGWQG